MYLLHEYGADPEPDSAWLLAEPSRMLNARYAIVGFTQRDQELAELAGWRDAREFRMAARWLHAPGGQGKTRLSIAFAHHSVGENWKVISAVHGTDSVLPSLGAQDLRLNDLRGVLLIVDYADRWPASQLASLFTNALLHQHVPARLLLIARTADAWPAVRVSLEAHQADCSDQVLAPLPDQPNGRQRMFTVARDAFAGHYRISDPSVIQPPRTLGDADFGLTLTVHMAALAAVDAAARGVAAPTDMAGLTAYLLDRERQHWTRLYENHAEGPEFGTAPATMGRAVFAAALTGAVSHSEGTAILTRLGIDGDIARILADQAACYPSAPPADAAVLEPLHPDRLAEDYLALTLPGHDISYPPDRWSETVPASLLISAGDTPDPRYTPRALTFLTAAAARWPHIGGGHLYPLLRSDPGLAVRGGSAVLTALADLPAVPADLLAAIAARFPEEGQADLDVGIAAVTRRLAAAALTGTRDPARTAPIRRTLARRLSRAGYHTEALAAQQEALRDVRQLAAVDAVMHAPSLARTLSDLANFLRQVGRYSEALSPAEEAVGIFQQLAGGLLPEAASSPGDTMEYLQRLTGSSPSLYEKDLGTALEILAGCTRRARGPGDAVAALRKWIRVLRRLAVTDLHGHEPSLVAALSELGVSLRQAGDPASAVSAFREAVERARRLATGDPGAYESQLARGLTSLADALTEVREYQERITIGEEAVTVYRRLAAASPAVHEPALVIALHSLGLALHQVFRHTEAVAAAEEAVEIARRLAAANPAAHERMLAQALDSLGISRAALGSLQPDGAALAAAEEAVSILRRLAAAEPARVEYNLALALAHLANLLAAADRPEDALGIASEGIAIRRRLVRANPAANEPHLAQELGMLATVTAATTDSPGEARAFMTECVGIYRRLAVNNPARFAVRLAGALIPFATMSVDTPADVEQARAALAEATGILAPLAEQGDELALNLLEAASPVRNLLEEVAEGRDDHAEATLSFRQAVLGGTVRLQLTGVPRTVTAKMPTDVRSGQRLRLRGQARPAADGGPPGDLYVRITLEPDEVFSRDGHNLTLTIPLTRSEASLGSDVQVPLVDGRAVRLRVPRGTPDGKTFRVPSHGLRRADGTKGDLRIRVKLTVDDVDAAALRADLIVKSRSAWQAYASQNPT